MASETSRSWTRTSASWMARRAFRVSSSGSPRPAPTIHTSPWCSAGWFPGPRADAPPPSLVSRGRVEGPQPLAPGPRLGAGGGALRGRAAKGVGPVGAARIEVDDRRLARDSDLAPSGGQYGDPLRQGGL